MALQSETGRQQVSFGETSEERAARLRQPLRFAPQRLAIDPVKTDVPLASPVEVSIGLAPGRIVSFESLQRKRAYVIDDSLAPVRIVREDGVKRIIEVTPMSLGNVELDIEAVYSDNVVVRQTTQLHVVPSAKGLKQFWLNGRFRTLTLSLGDDPAKSAEVFRAGAIFEQIKLPILLHDCSGIKMSVEGQDENDPVVKIDKDGTIHPLREGVVTVVGDFDGVTDRVLVNVTRR